MARWAHRLVGQFYGRLAWAYGPAVWLLTCGLYQRWMLTAEEFIEKGPVLEVGCGQGRLLAHLAQKGHSVIGVDISPQMVAIAQRRLSQTGSDSKVICCDARKLPLDDGSIGTIINTFPMPYVQEEATWAEYVRVLRPGGRWVVVVGPKHDKFHLRLLGGYLLLLAEHGLSLGRDRKGTAVPRQFFPHQRWLLVQVGGTSLIVGILEKAQVVQ